MPHMIQVGTFVKYRTASGRIRHAVVTGVTSQTKVDLRIGNGATAAKITGVDKKTMRDGGTAGWLRGSR